MPAPKKSVAKKSAPVSKSGPQRYHVYAIAQDLGEVSVQTKTELQDIVDLVTQGPANGMYVVFDEGGNASIVHLQPVTAVNTTVVDPKNLFS